MPDSPWPRVADVLADALDLAGPDRTALLDRACLLPDGRPDAELRAEVESLLAAADATDFLSPVTALVRDATLVDDLPLGTEIGPYRLGGVLGEGGMGVVYRAERADGLFERAVALKRLRPGPGPGRRTLAQRLQAERRLLARLEHPGIARLYDGGVSPDGTPYLAMELVEGRPLTAHADAEGLGVPGRVALLAQACDAVAYAHARLVVHRDLKPSNVLVTAQGRVKLLDFGIAKLLEDADGLHTQTHGAALTPAYAAPEQITRDEITTATDVYALGVMLYELLAGRRPFDVAGRSPAEVERQVLGGAPPPSSAAPEARRRAVRGDLDRIVQKAMAPEPERRYDAAAALADDLQRFLAGLPVDARAPTAAYRVSRFVRRHRAASTAALLAVLALAAALSLALWQARAAETERRTASRVNAFVAEMLASADPYGAGGQDVTVLQAVDAAAERVGTDLAGEPQTEAAVRLTLAETYQGVATYEKALDQAQRAHALYRSELGDQAPQTIAALTSVGTLLLEQSRFQEADSVLGIAVAALQGSGSSSRAAYAEALGVQGIAAYIVSDYARAETLLRASVAEADAVTDPSRELRRMGEQSRYYLGSTLQLQGDYDDADSVLSALVRELRAEPGQPSPHLGTALSTLAWNNDYLGRHEQVAPLLQESLALREARFGPDHPETAYALNDLAYYYHFESDTPEQAEPLYTRALAIFQATGSAAVVPTLLNNLGSFYTSRDRPEDAVPLLVEAARLSREVYGPGHEEVAFPLLTLGRTYVALGQPAQAEASLREVLAIREQELGPDNTLLGVALEALSVALHEQGRFADAAEVLRRSRGVYHQALGPDHREVAYVEVKLADALLAGGQMEARPEARSLLAHAAGVLQKVLAGRVAESDRRMLARADSLTATLD